MRYLSLLALLGLLASCQKAIDPTKEIWIYTSMYKDTVADLNSQLEVAFPGVKFNWYQAGSEEIAARSNGEIMAGGIRADILISSDRFWYEELARSNMLVSHKPPDWDKIPDMLKHPAGVYTTISIPVMVLTYHKEAVKNPPESFKEMALPKWKGKFTTGSPLASGTNFTTMAVLQYKYGWDYFTGLRNNGTISQGGNSAVIRRVQTLERPVGWVLLEDLLRLQGKDDRLGVVFPSDGVITHGNIMAITKKDVDRTLAKKVADWMLSNAGQASMTRSYMYSPLPDFPAPKGAPQYDVLMKNAFPWTPEFLNKITEDRIDIKDRFMEIMFQ